LQFGWFRKSGFSNFILFYLIYLLKNLDKFVETELRHSTSDSTFPLLCLLKGSIFFKSTCLQYVEEIFCSELLLVGHSTAPILTKAFRIFSIIVLTVKIRNSRATSQIFFIQISPTSTKRHLLNSVFNNLNNSSNGRAPCSALIK
jgi:hypothetical protein